MNFYRSLTDIELMRDQLVLLAGYHQLHNFPLALGQPFGTHYQLVDRQAFRPTGTVLLQCIVDSIEQFLTPEEVIASILEWLGAAGVQVD
jgi:hypothetical protein